MKKFLLYGHGGSYNHGAEAIAKCVIKYLRQHSSRDEYEIILSTHFAEQDKEFAVDADKLIERANGETWEEIYAPTINEITPETVCFHMGGDNYCYPRWERWATIHGAAKERGAVSILWSASIEPKDVTDETLEVYKTHDLITARDGITFKTLIAYGLENVIKVSDIAFTLEPIETELPFDREYVTLNLSPLVMRKNPVLLSAYRELVAYILSETDLKIALVPHVIQPVDNDTEALRELLIPSDERIKLVSGKNCAAQLKYIISKSRFCVTARTHAAIAAYSTGIPTLALGYSTKAYGIARDLSLGEYTINAAEINEPKKLTAAFVKLLKDEQKIKNILSEKIPNYTKKAIPKILSI
jgi:polysaccharide pyruvyl transferase WcaK-like protein